MTVVMVALVVAFAAGAVWFGVQAYRLGRRVGLVPVILAGLPVAFYLLLMVADLLNGDKPLGGSAGTCQGRPPRGCPDARIQVREERAVCGIAGSRCPAAGDVA